MRRPRMAQLFVATLIVVAIGWVFRYPAMYAWMRHTGSVAPHGTNNSGFMGKPGAVLTLVGSPPHVGDVSMSAPIGAYHVLVLFAADSLTEGEGSTTSSNVWEDATRAWNVWSGDRAVRREFSTHYDGFLRIARIGGRRYSLTRGNLFVVRYDARGRMSVQQLAHTFRGYDGFKAVETIQALLPADAAVRDLTRFDGPAQPCPRRQAPPPVSGAST
jgi:hypothetical protein